MMTKVVKSTYEKAIMAKEKRGEIVRLSRRETIRIDLCVIKSFNDDYKKRSRYNEKM